MVAVCFLPATSPTPLVRPTRALRVVAVAQQQQGISVQAVQQQQQQLVPQRTGRRAALAAAGAAAALAVFSPSRAWAGDALEVLSDEPGSGTAAARAGDLVLVHYTGSYYTGDDGQLCVFDTTRGEGLTYRDGGAGLLRPAIVRLGSGPVPGICAGLERGLVGMTVGGKRTVTFPASLGFGGQTVLAPYGIVPGGSSLTYTIELVRLSRRGPEELMSRTSKCGLGAANQNLSGCGAVTVAEFL